MATIKDVAKEADVSPSTVSRVINDHPRISQATRDRVREAMDKIGYHPNIIAQSLVNQKTNTIGLVMPYSAEEVFADPFYAEVLRGIGAVTQTKGYSLLLINCNGEEQELKSTMRAVKGKQVDGLLLLRAKRDDKLVTELKELDFPFVIVGRPEDEQNNYWVNNDNIQASKEVVEYLIELGHRNICLVTGSKEYIVYQDRWHGYKQALAENGLDYDSDYVLWIEGMQQEVYQKVKELLTTQPEVSAIFGVDDMMAYGAIQAIQELGLAIPDDIAVIGFNNNPLSKLITPALTTVDINTYQLGNQATKLLIRVINEEVDRYCHELVAADIIKRSSCGGRIE